MTDLDLGVLFGGDLDTAAWARRHRAGEVPDAFPYGLDRMTAHGVAARGLGAAHPLPRPVRGAARRLGGGLDWAGAALVRPGGDVVLAWDERVGVPFALLHRDDRPLVLNVIWATDTPPPRPLRAAVSRGLRRADRVFVLSSAQVAPLHEHYGVPLDRVDVVPFGVDADFFTPGPVGEVDRDLLVSVGNDRDRDFTTVLAAFRAVRARRPGARLTVVSHTAPAAEVQGVEGVELVPRLGHAELRALLRRAALTLTLTRPNLHASGVTAVLETLAVARPAVSTANPGMNDYVTPGGGPVLVPVGDAPAAAAAALALLEDPAGADDSGQGGRRAVEDAFSTARQAEHLAALVRRAHAGG